MKTLAAEPLTQFYGWLDSSVPALNIFDLDPTRIFLGIFIIGCLCLLWALKD